MESITLSPHYTYTVSYGQLDQQRRRKFWSDDQSYYMYLNGRRQFGQSGTVCGGGNRFIPDDDTLITTLVQRLAA